MCVLFDVSPLPNKIEEKTIREKALKQHLSNKERERARNRKQWMKGKVTEGKLVGKWNAQPFAYALVHEPVVILIEFNFIVSG